MFSFNHFYCISGVSHFILDSEKWTWDVLQALLFLECILSGIYWGNTYLLRVGGMCLWARYRCFPQWHWNDPGKWEASRAMLLHWHGFLSVCLLSEVWMSWGNFFRTTESQCLSASSVFRKTHPSLRCFWTPVFVLVCVFHCVTFVWCMYVFLFPKHAYAVVQVLGPRVMAFVM